MALALGLQDSDLPNLHAVADSASMEGQSRFIRATRLRLAAAVIAACVGAAIQPGPMHAILSIVVALAFLSALLLESWVWATAPEAQWYDGRAVAESAKTMAWRYAVGAAPYPRSEADSRSQLVHDLKRLLTDAPTSTIRASVGQPVSVAMEALRRAPWQERRSVYLRDRIENQRRWYASKSETSRKRASQWRAVLILAEGLGVLAAFLRFSDTIDLDLAGILGALVGAGVAWLSVRQHDSLYRAYAFASVELGIAAEDLATCTSEDEWAQKAADAEEAISREHTMWRASRSAT